MYYKVIHLLIGILFVSLPLLLKAEQGTPQIYVLNSESQATSKKIINFLYEHYAVCCLITFTDNETLLEKEISTKSGLLLTLGNGALKASSALMQFHQLALFVNYSDYQRQKGECDQCSAIFNSPSIEEQVKSVKKLFGNHLRPVVFYRQAEWGGDEKARLLDQVRFEKVVDTEGLLRKLKQFDDEILMSVPDPDLYELRSTQYVIRALYRKGRMFFGQNESHIRLGAVAALVATPEDLFRQLNTLIDLFLQTGKLSPPENIKTNNLVINNPVAQSLDLILE